MQSTYLKFTQDKTLQLHTETFKYTKNCILIQINVRLYKIMYTINEQKILEIIFDNPTTNFYMLELAKKAKLHPNTTIDTLNALEKKGLIKQEKKKHLKQIAGNKENPQFNIEKKISNISKVYNSGIIEFLKEKYAPEAISIVGSYSRGEDIEESDIDLVVITKKHYNNDNLEKFEKIFKRKIHLIISHYKELSEEFYINLINGIVLQGTLDKKDG